MKRNCKIERTKKKKKTKEKEKEEKKTDKTDFSVKMRSSVIVSKKMGGERNKKNKKKVPK